MTDALLVARVSTDATRQDLDSQLIALRRAADRHGWTVYDELELETSAWTPVAAQRVRNAVLDPVRDGHADVVAVWALDRVVRGGIVDAFRFLRQLEDHLGARFYSVQESFLSTATASPAERDVLLSMRAWMDERESSRISERVRKKVQSKRNRAGVLNERAVWGEGELATPLELQMVHHLTELGYSRREVARRLDLSKSQVQRIVKNDLRPEDVLTDEQLDELVDDPDEILDEVTA